MTGSKYMNGNSLKPPDKVFYFNNKYNRKAKKLSKNLFNKETDFTFNVQANKSWSD